MNRLKIIYTILLLVGFSFMSAQETTGIVYTITLKGIYQFDIVEKEKGWTTVAEKIAGYEEIDQKRANDAFKMGNHSCSCCTAGRRK